MTIAAHWRPAADGAVDCGLCYRACHLADGETGWCGTRTNDGGSLAADADGLLSYSVVSAPLDFAFNCGQFGFFVGGLACTSACSFCDAGAVALDPQRLPVVAAGTEQWSQAIGQRSPEETIDLAEGLGMRRIGFIGNEPLLSYEWTLATAQLAKARGWDVSIDTNGYAPPAVIREIAPYIDHAVLGVKFSASEAHYDKHMASAGAVPHVLRSIETWHETATVVTVVDVIGPPRWVSDAEAESDARRFYTWLAETCGPLTILDVRGMWVPEKRPVGLIGGEAAWVRVQRMTEIAREVGLLYAVAGTGWQGDEVTLVPRVDCHHCGSNLLPNRAPGHRCRGCGGAVPIVTRGATGTVDLETGPSPSRQRDARSAA